MPPDPNRNPAARGGRGGVRGGRGGLWVSAKRPRSDAPPASSLGDPDKDALLLVPLPASRRAKVFTFTAAATGGKEGGALLDIREMWPKDGLPYALPSKKGICLTLPQAEALFARGDAILAAMRGARGGGGAGEATEGGEAGEEVAAPEGEEEGGDDAAAAAAAAAARAARKAAKRAKREEA
jgi:hypothetical protein